MNKKTITEEFKIAAEQAVATVEIIAKNALALNNALIKATEKEELVLLAEPTDLDAELFSKYKNNPKVITTPTQEQLRTIRCGITDAFGAVLSTGSVCVEVSNGLASPASMLTRKHIAVVDADSIVERPKDVLSEKHLNGKGLLKSFSFITGSSATADMGPLVRGVHGPGELHIIILE